MKIHFLKKVRQVVEAGLAWGMFMILEYGMTLNVASGFAGWVARKLSIFLSTGKRARKNMKKCFPELSDHEIDQYIDEMWDNFGRLFTEYAHPKSFWDGKTLRRIEVVGIEHLKQFRDDGKPGVIFTGHLANWQMITIVGKSIGFELTQMYRPANNRWVDALMLRSQKKVVDGVITKKGSGPKALLAHIKNGGHAFLLVDQKMGEGVTVPFLGRPAKTATGIAKLYLDKNCPLLPAKVERLKGSTFRVTFYPPIDYVPEGKPEKDVYELLLRINTIIGSWVKERPGQWLWIHRRWEDS